MPEQNIASVLYELIRVDFRNFFSFVLIANEVAVGTKEKKSVAVIVLAAISCPMRLRGGTFSKFGTERRERAERLCGGQLARFSPIEFRITSSGKKLTFHGAFSRGKN